MSLSARAHQCQQGWKCWVGDASPGEASEGKDVQWGAAKYREAIE